MDKSTEPIFWLKEFSKSWVNIVSDEVVYCEQVSERESRGVISVSGNGRTYVKEYLSSKLWLEILFRIRKFGNLEFYIALIETCETIQIKKLMGARQASSNGNFGCSRENNAMLVNVVNNGEDPKEMSALLPIRSVIRLNRLDISPDVLTEVFKPPDEFRTLLSVDWEDGISGAFDSNSPSDVVKSGTQSVSDLTYQKPPSLRELPREIRPEDIASILQVSIDSTSVRLTCDEGLDFSVEDIKVFLRPIDSDEGVSHLLHMLSPCE